MDIRQIITEEIADFLNQVEDQKINVKRSIENFENENDELQKIKKQIKSEAEKQKLFKLEAQLLKEKIIDSKRRMDEMKTRAKILAKTED